GQHHDDDEQRKPARYPDPGFDQHLQAHETENNRQPNAQVDETRHEIGEQEVKRAQAENGADVRGIDNESVACDREHRRDGVDGKNQVHHLDHDENQRERREHAPATDEGDELWAVVIVRHGKHAADESQDEVVLQVDRLRFAEQHTQPGDDEKDAKNKKNKME